VAFCRLLFDRSTSSGAGAERSVLYCNRARPLPDSGVAEDPALATRVRGIILQRRFNSGFRVAECEDPTIKGPNFGTHRLEMGNWDCYHRPMHAVETRALTKTFGDLTAVDDLSLTVPQGSVYGFIGPNGSGKTTTMRMLVNIFYPDRGSIAVFGEDSRAVPSGTIGYLPEERGLYRRMNVKPLLEFHAELRGGRNAGPEIDRWLERFGLAQFANKRVDTLSKGMSQKVQFIAAVVPEPKLLILDEPFTGLDPVSTDVLRESILELRRRGASIILSTHDMGVAESMCDYILMIYRGRKVLDGTLDAIQEQYGNDTLRVAAANDDCAGLPGVEKVRDLGQIRELRMTRGCDPQDVLRALIARTRVTSFSVAKPSLHDIFVRIAGPEAAESSPPKAIAAQGGSHE